MSRRYPQREQEVEYYSDEESSDYSYDSASDEEPVERKPSVKFRRSAPIPIPKSSRVPSHPKDRPIIEQAREYLQRFQDPQEEYSDDEEDEMPRQLPPKRSTREKLPPAESVRRVPKSVHHMDDEELAYLKTPVGRAVYKDNFDRYDPLPKVGRPSKFKQQYGEKLAGKLEEDLPEGKIRCPICDVVHSKSNGSRHRQTRAHQMGQKLFETTRRLLYGPQ